MNSHNVFIKSMIRQPLRTVVLVLLVAASAYSFVMRAAEYISVDEFGDFLNVIAAHNPTCLIPAHKTAE